MNDEGPRPPAVAVPPKRVLFLTRKWPPAVGGMESYAVELVRELGAQGHVVDLRALPGRAGGRTPSALGLVGFGIGAALRLLTGRAEWDAVHGADMAVWPLVALARLRRPGLPAVLSAHGTDVALAHGSGLAARVYRTYLEAAVTLLPRVRVAANSAATARLIDALGFNRVVTIPLACRPVAPEGDVPEGRFLLFAGRLQVRKGLSWFVENVLPSLPGDVRLLVAGPPWDADEARALGAQRVEALGPVDPARLTALAAAAVAVVVPNRPGPGRFEGFGLIAVEAAAAGGLVLASRLDGFETSVIDGKTGRLLPPDDPKAWREAIEEILSLSPEARQARSDRARRIARDRFDWARVAEETAALY